MKRFLLAVLLAFGIAGCATVEQPHRLAQVEVISAADMRAAVEVVNRETVPAVVVRDVEPVEGGLLGQVLNLANSQEWLPYHNSQAPPLDLALSVPIETLLFGTQVQPSLSLNLQTTLVPERNYGSGTPTYTRATTAEQTDFEGKLNLVPSGAARMQGARVVWNLLSITPIPSEDISGALWTISGSGSKTATVATFNTLSELYLTNGVTLGSSPNNRTFLFSVELTAGTASSVYLGATDTLSWGAGRGFQTATPITIAATPTRYSFLWTPTAAVGNKLSIVIGLLAQKGQAAGTQPAGTMTITKFNVEDVTGQANQNPSEYVSVGVLSAPFHGAGVDGVKYFSTLNGNTVASNVVTEATGAPINSSTSKFAVLPGVSGSYLRTPNAAVNQITGDIDIRVDLAPSGGWASGSASILAAKSDGVGNRSYELYLDTAAKLQFYSSVMAASATSTSAVSFAASTRGSVRVTRASASGDVIFYTSTDNGANWVKLGNTVSQTAGALTSTTMGVTCGAYNTGTLFAYVGKIYRAQIYNGIDGTLAVDFNPNLSTDAQTFTAATGEVWTTNGTARIYGNTHATYGIPALWDADGPLGYLAEGARTNSILQSNTLGTTWTVSNAADMNAVVADQYVSVDGATTMDKLQPKATTAVHSLNQAFTFTAAKYTACADLRYVSATPQRWVALILNDGTTTWGASFDLLNGVVGAVSAGATSTIEATAQANVYRACTTNTANAAAAAGTLKISLNATDTATLESAARAGTETLGAGMVQLEVGTFASTRIITTTVAVTRNADVLTYASAGNISGTAGSVSVEVTTAGVQGVNGNIVSRGSGGGGVLLYLESTNTINIFDGTGIATLAAAARPYITPVKFASSWGANMGTFTGGSAGTRSAFDGDMSLAAAISIGHDSGILGFLFGTIRKVRIYPVALPSSRLQVLMTAMVDLSDSRYMIAANDDYWRIAASQ